MAAGALSAILERYGSAPRLTPLAAPRAPVGDEVVVAMRFAPINLADLLMIDGRYPHGVELPSVLGAEGVGEVLAIGPGVRRTQVADHVLPLVRGAWCGWRCLREDEAVRAPRDLALEQAAMLRINASTAWRLLRHRDLGPGDVVVQNAARSSVARFVRMLAREMGVGVINVIRDEPREEEGCWLVDGPDLAARVRDLAGGRRLRLALDCVAGTATARMAELLDERGKVIVFGHLSGNPCEAPSTLLTSKRLLLEGFSLRPAEADDPPGAPAAIVTEMARLMGITRQTLPVRQVFPLSALDEALRAARSPGQGRVLLALDG